LVFILSAKSIAFKESDPFDNRTDPVVANANNSITHP